MNVDQMLGYCTLNWIWNEIQLNEIAQYLINKMTAPIQQHFCEQHAKRINNEQLASLANSARVSQ